MKIQLTNGGHTLVDDEDVYREESGKYVAQICINKVRTKLGRFDTATEAAYAYDAAAIAQWGEFANVNFAPQAALEALV